MNITLLPSVQHDDIQRATTQTLPRRDGPSFDEVLERASTTAESTDEGQLPRNEEPRLDAESTEADADDEASTPSEEPERREPESRDASRRDDGDAEQAKDESGESEADPHASERASEGKGEASAETAASEEQSALQPLSQPVQGLDLPASSSPAASSESEATVTTEAAPVDDPSVVPVPPTQQGTQATLAGPATDEKRSSAQRVTQAAQTTDTGTAQAQAQGASQAQRTEGAAPNTSAAPATQATAATASDAAVDTTAAQTQPTVDPGKLAAQVTETQTAAKPQVQAGDDAAVAPQATTNKQTPAGAERATQTQTPRSLDPRILLAAEANRESVFRQIALRLVGDGGEMRLQLDPPELGALDIQLVEKGGVLRLHIHTERPELTHLLDKHIGELRQSLAEQGLSLAEAQIHARERGDQGGAGHGQDSDGGANDDDASADDARPAHQPYITATGLDFYA